MGRNRTYDRNDVLNKAMNLFWRKGYEGAHLQELVDVTGLNRFSLYKEFGGKEGIFSEAISRYLSDARVYYEPLFHKPHGLDNIYNYFESIQFSKGYHGCFAVKTLTDQHIVNSSEFIKVKTFFKKIEKTYLDNLKTAQTNGDIKKHKDIKALSKLLLTLDLGLAVYGILIVNKNERKQITSFLPLLLA